METASNLDLSRQKGFGMFAWSLARSKRYLINIIFAFVAVGLEVYYSICGGACSYLKGDLFSIPLQYIGIAYMTGIVLFSLLKKDLFLILLLSSGVGIELYLIGFQTWYDTYCPYCLAFAGIVIFLFFVNFDKARVRMSCIAMGTALVLFSIFFQGSVTPSYADEPLVPSFGEGKVKVRLYTDYFCPPCRAMEPDIEPVLTELVKRRIITLLFVDTPMYKSSSLYARYFLYALHAQRDFDHALIVRRRLMAASRDKSLDSEEKLEAYFKFHKIAVKPFEPKPSFDVLSGYLKEDQVKSTPICVIVRDGKKEILTGGPDIVGALKGLAAKGP